jgi:hypothetical protein
MKIVTVHGELVKEAKEETAGRFGGRGWRLAEDRSDILEGEFFFGVVFSFVLFSQLLS